MKLLHLYYDIMNLYGDYANVSAMKRILEKSGEQVTVDRLTLGDSVDFSQYDFVYIGSGTERNLRVVLEDFRDHTAEFDRYVSVAGKVALLTGNSFEMLGREIGDGHGDITMGMNLYRFDVKLQNKTRLTSDVIYTCDFLEQPLVGFVNKCTELTDIREHLFQVQMGLGDNADSRFEGLRERNLFGTHLTGPVLIKNPHFLAYLAKLILGREPETSWMVHEKAGYEVTLHELSKRAGT